MTSPGALKAACTACKSTGRGGAGARAGAGAVATFSAAIAAATLVAAPFTVPRCSGAFAAAEAGAVPGVTDKTAPGAELLLGDEEVAFFCLGGICRAADACLSGCNWGVFCTVKSGRPVPTNSDRVMKVASLRHREH